jgi:c-di-GMP-binding flagellar brake protein YcgR
MSPSSTSERRQAVRLAASALPPVDANLTCMSSGKILSGRLVDVSASGCRIALDQGQVSETGIRCAVRFELGDRFQRYDLLATIVRRSQTCPAMELGLRFDGLEANRLPRQRLGQAIAQWAARPETGVDDAG